MNQDTVHAMISAATPFLRIDGIRPRDWCRNVKKGSRFGPWRYEAVYTPLDNKTWSREGEVLYFVTDRNSRLRLVGESSKCLKDRWRTSPMHDVQTREMLGAHALFHSTAWAAIERGFDVEAPPFTVSALFRDELVRVMAKRPAMLQLPDDGATHLSRRVESTILAAVGSELALWNRKGVRSPSRS